MRMSFLVQNVYPGDGGRSVCVPGRSRNHRIYEHGQYHDHQHHHQKTGTGRFAGCGYDQQTAKPNAPVRRPVFYPGNCSRIPDRGPPRRLQSLSVYEKCRMDWHSHVSRPSGGNTLYDSCHHTAPINALIHLEQKCEKGIPGGKDSAPGVKKGKKRL